MVRQFLDPLTGEPRFRIDHSFRMEPLPRSNEVASGLAARIHDAAWMLTRQWQFGEFIGQDGGSPVAVTIRGQSERISAWRPLPEDQEPPPWRRYRVAQGPLDPRVESEGRAKPDLRMRIEGGVHLADMLRERGRDAALRSITAACPIGEVPDDLGLLALLAAEVPDGAEVARRMAAGGVGPVAAKPALAEWLAWWKARVVGPAQQGAFNEHRFEHRFELSCGDKVLRAEEHGGDGLDWHSVDSVGGTPATAAAPFTFTTEGLATPIRYGGLPADRFWEMEDAKVDLAAADVSTIDTGRLLLLGFAEVYGNDWFVVPLEVPVGSLTTLGRVVVTDSFGDKWKLKKAGNTESGWNMYAVTGTDDGLLILPSIRGQAGEPLETVALARDELANTAWAVEQTFTDGHGRLVDRREAWLRDEPDLTRPGELPAYEVQTVVPDYWLPLIPVRIPDATDDESIRFEVARLVQPLPGGARNATPRGRLLSLEQWIHEEEVPRDGARLARRPVLARWYDGSWHSWTRREKNAGSGESSSGLAFDVVRPSDPWP